MVVGVSGVDVGPEPVTRGLRSVDLGGRSMLSLA
jgi:hypothetical protein